MQQNKSNKLQIQQIPDQQQEEGLAHLATNEQILKLPALSQLSPHSIKTRLNQKRHQSPTSPSSHITTLEVTFPFSQIKKSPTNNPLYTQFTIDQLNQKRTSIQLDVRAPISKSPESTYTQPTTNIEDGGQQKTKNSSNAYLHNSSYNLNQSKFLQQPQFKTFKQENQTNQLTLYQQQIIKIQMNMKQLPIQQQIQQKNNRMQATSTKNIDNLQQQMLQFLGQDYLILDFSQVTEEQILNNAHIAGIFSQNIEDKLNQYQNEYLANKHAVKQLFENINQEQFFNLQKKRLASITHFNGQFLLSQIAMSISKECAHVVNLMHFQIWQIINDYENYIIKYESNYIRKLDKIFNPFEKQMQQELNIGVRTLIKVYDNELQHFECQYAKAGIENERTKKIKDIINIKSKLKSENNTLGQNLFELLDSLDSLLASNYQKIENMTQTIDHLQNENKDLINKIYSLDKQNLEKKGQESKNFVDFKRESMDIIIKKNEETVKTIEEYYKVRIEALNSKLDQLQEKLNRKKKKKQELNQKIKQLQEQLVRENEDKQIQCEIIVSHEGINSLNIQGGSKINSIFIGLNNGNRNHQLVNDGFAYYSFILRLLSSAIYQNPSVHTNIMKEFTIFMINLICQEKFNNDILNQQEHRQSRKMLTFCSEFFSTKFANPIFGHYILQQFFIGLRSFYKDEKRVEIFARLCEIPSSLITTGQQQNLGLGQQQLQQQINNNNYLSSTSIQENPLGQGIQINIKEKFIQKVQASRISAQLFVRCGYYIKFSQQYGKLYPYGQPFLPSTNEEGNEIISIDYGEELSRVLLSDAGYPILSKTFNFFQKLVDLKLNPNKAQSIETLWIILINEIAEYVYQQIKQLSNLLNSEEGIDQQNIMSVDQDNVLQQIQPQQLPEISPRSQSQETFSTQQQGLMGTGKIYSKTTNNMDFYKFQKAIKKLLPEKSHRWIEIAFTQLIEQQDKQNEIDPKKRSSLIELFIEMADVFLTQPEDSASIKERNQFLQKYMKIDTTHSKISNTSQNNYSKQFADIPQFDKIANIIILYHSNRYLSNILRDKKNYKLRKILELLQDNIKTNNFFNISEENLYKLQDLEKDETQDKIQQLWDLVQQCAVLY